MLTSDRDAAGVAAAYRRAARAALCRAAHGARRSPPPSTAARAARSRATSLASFDPDLVYVANCVAIPQAAPLVAAASGMPVVYRLSELFMASSLYRGDRYLRTCFPGSAGCAPPWAHAMRAAQSPPALGLDPSAPASRRRLVGVRRAPRRTSRCPHSIERRARTHDPPGHHTGGGVRGARARARGPAEVLYLGRVTTAKGIEVAYQRARGAPSRARHRRRDSCRWAPPSRRWSARSRGSPRELGIADVDRRPRPARDRDARAACSREAGAIVLPTVEWDVFPLVLIEAGLARVPIVAARIGGVPEAVADGEHALLFEPGDAAGVRSRARGRLPRPRGRGRARRARVRADAVSCPSRATGGVRALHPRGGRGARLMEQQGAAVDPGLDPLVRESTRRLRLAATVVLARILVPADFGLFALTSLAISLLSIFNDFGRRAGARGPARDLDRGRARTALSLMIMLASAAPAVLLAAARRSSRDPSTSRSSTSSCCVVPRQPLPERADLVPRDALLQRELEFGSGFATKPCRASPT